jgi:acyl-CoA synthetase (AMP-forming)/AMP-acid ligase II
MAATLWQGGTLVTLPRFDLEQFLAILHDYRVTLAFVVPPIMLAMAKHPLVDRFDLSGLRFVGSAAAPLGAELEEACGKRLGCVVGQGYGLTETGPVLTAHPSEEARIRHGSAGQLLPNTEAKVVDPITGAALGRDQDGELCFRGPQVMAGYLNRAQETAQVVDPDRWLHTGDIGHIDDDGYFWIVDRVKELIKYKGLQVAPAELEAVLLTHPGIADAVDPGDHGVCGRARGSLQEGPPGGVRRRDPQVAVGQDPAARAHGPRPAGRGRSAELASRSGRCEPLQVGVVVPQAR